MYANVILPIDAVRECARYGRSVTPAQPTGGPSEPPLLYSLSGRQWQAVDTVLAVLGFLTTELAFRSGGWHRWHAIPLRIGLALLGSAPIAFRRRWPLPALALVTAALATLTILGRSSLLLSVMLGLVGYTVAAQLPRRSSVWAFAGAELSLGLALWIGVKVGNAGRGPVGIEAIQSILPLAAAWFVGDSVSARRAYLAGLAEQNEQQRVTEAERSRQGIRGERVRIARELHDVVAHSLAVITVQAGVGRRLMAKDPEEAVKALESIEATGRTAQDELRVVLGLLRDDENEGALLQPAPGLKDLDELVETVRAAGTSVELRTSGTDRQLSPALGLSVYRIIQEALTNVVKHAPGAHATVDLVVLAREVTIEVADDGAARQERPLKTMSEPAASPGSKHGIVGMHERVSAFGGSLVAEAVPGRGFRVAARIPLTEMP
jgi:signal transduction histidine kinase